MSKFINYTPGPSELYFTAEDHVRTAFREGIPSLSHRSRAFEAISKNTTDCLRELLGIPTSHHIYFTGSANEIWERIVQNLVEEKSFHLVNGAFSKRFFEIAKQLNKRPEKAEVENGKGFAAGVTIDADSELIAVTHNETSTGVTTPLPFIHSLGAAHPDALIAVDAVSSLPYPAFDFSAIDTAFFSVQKGFGLPAGLGVWIVNDRCLSKADYLLSKGISIGSYHTLPMLHSHAVKNQTPETPNVLGIYMLGRIVSDMLTRGITAIRKETEYKAAVLYNALHAHPLIDAFVTDKAVQSKTVIVAQTGEHTEAITQFLLKRNIQPGDGYGASKKTQLRFANFPTHSKEHFESLADALSAFTG